MPLYLVLLPWDWHFISGENRPFKMDLTGFRKAEAFFFASCAKSAKNAKSARHNLASADCFLICAFFLRAEFLQFCA